MLLKSHNELVLGDQPVAVLIEYFETLARNLLVAGPARAQPRLLAALHALAELRKIDLAEEREDDH